MRRLSFIACVAVAVALPSPRAGFAYHNGIAGYSGMDHGLICTACHFGGKVPTVAFTGPTTLAPGATGDFTFTVTSSAPSVQTNAGFNVAADGGKLAVVSGQGEQLCDPGVSPCGNVGHELTHTAPKKNDASGHAMWTFKWTAPSTPGLYTLWGAGNSVHVDSDPTDDRAAGTTFMIMVGEASTATPTAPLPTDTPTPGTADTATVTPLPEATATSAPTDTPTLTPTDTLVPTAVPTPTASASATAAATATPGFTTTPTPRGQPGDANCDGSLSAADLSAEAIILSGGDFPCGGADVNADGATNDDDVPALLQLLFEPLAE